MSSAASQNRTEELSKRIRFWLSPGEEIWWVGQPEPACYRHMNRKTQIVAAVPLTFSVAMLLLLWALPINQRSQGFHLGMYAAFVFGTVGILMAATPWMFPRRLRRTIYAVTNRRAIVLNPYGELQADFMGSAFNGLAPIIDRYEPVQVSHRKLQPRAHGGVDIVLAVYVSRRRAMNVGFLGLESAAEAEGHLARLASTQGQNEN